MKSRDFCYWLQGYFELAAQATITGEVKAISATQAESIKRHLALVFAHEIDTEAGNDAEQSRLNILHNGNAGGDTLPTNNGSQGSSNPNFIMRC